MTVLSVVIVSYNNFATTTGPCLASLRQDDTDMEIIVVDNGSDATTRRGLIEAVNRDSRIRLLLNRTNLGYAGGTNAGADVAASDLLLLLNSDTRVLPAITIPRLVKLMEEHPDWSMLGPVSNQVGNDQQIYTRGGKVREIMVEGAKWCAHSLGYFYPTDILSFCCVLIRTDFYWELDGLDESFGLGYYEDTDFNYRAAAKGATLMITEDAFVYHRGSGSFDAASPEVQAMVKENRKLFRKKHGHGITAAHWRDKNLAAMRRYLERADDLIRLDLVYRFRNREKLAWQLMPNSPLKKLLYVGRLRRVIRDFRKRFA